MIVDGYIRVSTDRQAEQGQGLEVQEAEIRDWARRYKHKMRKVWREEGVSGSNGIEARIALPKAMEALSLGDCKGIVVARLDRLARDLTVQEAILSRVWKYDGRLFAADVGEIKQDDPDDPMRTAMRQLVGVISQLDRAMISKRLRDGRQAKAAKGGYAYGGPPFGWKSEDGILVEVPEEQELIAEMRQLAKEENLTPGDIAGVLNTTGILTKRGTKWHPTTVKRILARTQPM